LCFLALFNGIYAQKTISLNIRVDDTTVNSSQVMLKKLHLTNPAILKFSGLNSKIEQIIGFYENSGYPFVRVSLDSIKPGPDQISTVLLIKTGDFIRIDTIQNRTGFRISPLVLYRLMNVRPGDPYNESGLKAASVRLMRVPFMSQLRPLEVGFYPGKASVYVYPEKAGSNRFDGWVGLSPDLRSAGALAFSGALSLSLDNILRQAENWQFNWNRNQDGSQRLNLAGNIPYIAGLPVGFRGAFELFRQDTSYLNMGWEAGIPYQFDPDQILNLFIRKRESSILSDVQDIQNSTRQPFVSLLSGLTWELKKLDNPINPYRGLEFKLEVSTGRKSIPDSISMQQSEYYAKIVWFQPLAKSITCAFIVQSGYRRSNEIYENEQYRLGGLNLLRGFDEDVFHTDAFAVTSLELRYILDRTAHLILLSDVGFLRDQDNPVSQMQIPVGLGLGGQVRTGGGIFRIIFAVGRQPGQTFNIKNSKIHLGYIGVF